jgi:3-keto-disaccharide hydrolase
MLKLMLKKRRATVGTLQRIRTAVSVVTIAACATVTCAQDQAHNTLTPQEVAQGFTLLFSGHDLDGWTTSGNLESWSVRDGELLTGGKGGWWLRTQKQYRDFDLRLEFNIPAGGNSGVGIRGSTVGDPAFTGMEVQIYDTYGKDPALNACGAVYNAIAPTSMAINRPGEWNTYRILLQGDTLNVWLNDVQIHEDQKLDDRGYFRSPEQKMPLNARLTTGYIALQDHGNPVRFRSIRIKDLSPDKDPGGFEPMFNGKDLTGWNARGNGEWTVEGGTLIGRKGPGHLFTNQSWSDMEMRAHVKLNTRGNSGFYFRTVPNADNPDSWPTGYEAQIDNHDPKNFTGCIYDRAWGEKVETPDNAWFDYRVRAVGDHIQTWINGVQAVDATLDLYERGHIALQTHHEANEVQWRDIQVRVIEAGQDAAADVVSPASN